MKGVSALSEAKKSRSPVKEAASQAALSFPTGEPNNEPAEATANRVSCAAVHARQRKPMPLHGAR